jgi:putative hydrolase of the HAD superfamily
MTGPRLETSNIEAILFDMNGTLRRREPHEPTQQAAFDFLRNFLGEGEHDWDELTRRQKAYSNWAQEQLIQFSEAEIWSRWILPDVPREQIDPVAAELMLAWSERKGHVVPVPGAEETLVELKRRGYRLGVISNTMSTLDIPRSLDSFGWTHFFDVMILSADLKIRKPAPEPFLEAARRLNIAPERCAYLGNRISKDIVGCQRAGFALGFVIEPASGPRPDEMDQTVVPDSVIHALGELLEIFPARVGQG